MATSFVSSAEARCVEYAMKKLANQQNKSVVEEIWTLESDIRELNETIAGLKNLEPLPTKKEIVEAKKVMREVYGMDGRYVSPKKYIADNRLSRGDAAEYRYWFSRAIGGYASDKEAHAKLAAAKAALAAKEKRYTDAKEQESCAEWHGTISELMAETEICWWDNLLPGMTAAVVAVENSAIEVLFRVTFSDGSVGEQNVGFSRCVRDGFVKVYTPDGTDGWYVGEEIPLGEYTKCSVEQFIINKDQKWRMSLPIDDEEDEYY